MIRRPPRSTLFPPTLFRSMGQQAVIGIEKNQVLATAGAEPRITSRRETMVGLTDQAHALVPAGSPRRLPGTAIIHYDGFKVPIRLRQGTLNCLCEELILPV